MLLCSQKEFCDVNSKLWNENDSQSKRYFLVEGLLAEIPTHLVRLGIVANAIRDVTNMTPVVILYSYNEEIQRLFRSFGISEFVYLDDTKLNLMEKACIVVKMTPYIFCRKVKYMLSAAYKGVNFGHLVFDGIIHSNETCYTVEKVNRACISSFYRCNKFIKKYSKMIARYKTDMVLLTHNEYVEYGALSVTAIANGNIIVNISDFEFSISRKKNEIYWHERLRAGLKKVISHHSIDELIKEGEKQLEKRLDGVSGLFDTKYAFINKKEYTREELAERYTHNTKKNIFIFMHVFSDAPHLSKMTMYSDYYEWIIDTIDKIRNIDNVNWYIKAHPSAFLYGETNKIREMMKTSKGNVFWTPDDFNTSSIKNVADAIITCQGTVGIEASCMGIPVVITGLPYYSRFGFTIEPKTRQEYYLVLNRMHKIRKLSIEKVKKAQVVMGAYSEYTFSDNTILDSEVYEYSGYGERTDYEHAYSKIVENMRDKIKEDIPLYVKGKEILEEYIRNVDDGLKKTPEV